MKPAFITGRGEYDGPSNAERVTPSEPRAAMQDARRLRRRTHALSVGFARYSTSAPRISFVVPTLNEARNLPHVLPKIPAWIDEVVIVDGRSSDDTVAVARRLRPDIVVVMEQKRGKGAALRAGFAAASGDIIVMIDADGSMDPAEVTLFVGALLSGADMVKGSRFLQGGGTDDMSGFRMLGNWGLTQIVKRLFGGSYSDLCYGYAAFWTSAIRALDLDADGFEIETQMNVRALQSRLRIVEVPSFESDRIYGSSNLRAIPDGWRVLKTILREYRAEPKMLHQAA